MIRFSLLWALTLSTGEAAERQYSLDCLKIANLASLKRLPEDQTNFVRRFVSQDLPRTLDSRFNPNSENAKRADAEKTLTSVEHLLLQLKRTQVRGGWVDAPEFFLRQSETRDALIGAFDQRQDARIFDLLIEYQARIEIWTENRSGFDSSQKARLLDDLNRIHQLAFTYYAESDNSLWALHKVAELRTRLGAQFSPPNPLTSAMIAESGLSTTMQRRLIQNAVRPNADPYTSHDARILQQSFQHFVR